jgi:hypothetical protein
MTGDGNPSLRVGPSPLAQDDRLGKGHIKRGSSTKQVVLHRRARDAHAALNVETLGLLEES